MGTPDEAVKSAQKAAIEELEGSGGIGPAKLEGWFKDCLEGDGVTITQKRRSNFRYWDISSAHITAEDRIKIQQEGPFNLARHSYGAFYWVDNCDPEAAEEILREFGMSEAFQAIYREAAKERYDGIQFDCDGHLYPDLPQFEDQEPGYPFSRVKSKDYPLEVNLRIIEKRGPKASLEFSDRTIWYYQDQIKILKRGLFLVQLEGAIKRFYPWAEGGYPLDS